MRGVIASLSLSAMLLATAAGAEDRPLDVIVYLNGKPTQAVIQAYNGMPPPGSAGWPDPVAVWVGSHASWLLPGAGWTLVTVEVAEQPPVKGDINDDGQVDLVEAVHALQVVTGVAR